MRLSITKTTAEGVHVLRFRGNLDALDSIAMPSKLQPYTRKNMGTIVVDLTESTFVDSQWLAVFLRFNELTREQGNRLFFLIPAGTVRELFVSTGLGKVFNLIDDVGQIARN
jgi:anti-anti-sigma factor